MCRIMTDVCPFCDMNHTYCLTHTPAPLVVAAFEDHLADHVEEMTRG
jgi:hypothetical protein